MTLTLGEKIGPYEILAPLGAGGMGEVYRARDTRLDRDVAIKVLPQHLSRSPEFKQRFEREARSISQLTHPHICTLYDVGHYEGTDYLVMELLEGETLGQRLTKGALPLEQVLKVGVEIASALDAAHRKGVVHRDLKPGNVMLTKTGAKLLDFGLAKSASVLSSSPSAVTVTQPLTSKGTILGTFQYMAPEQLEGTEADARTDIFAFGAVLYEMATGKRAFDGHSRASLIASIMASQPRPISELQPMTPPALDRLIRKCLAKDPDSRWQSAADVADELRWITESGSQIGTAVSPAARRGSWKLVAGFTLLVATCVALALFGANILKEPAPVIYLRTTILPPDDATLVSTSIFAGPVVVSPDGSQLAFVARQGEGRTILWVRSLQSFNARALEGTEGATRPFWSADSRHLGFFTADGKLKKVQADGGAILTLATTPESRGGTWNRDGVIVYAPHFIGPLYAISASGGTPKPVTQLDADRNENTHRYPCFLPDGRHFLYLARSSGAGAGEEPAIKIGALDSPENKIVLHGASNVAYASNHLLYVREGTLVAHPFDLDRFEVVGHAVPVVQDLLLDERFSLGVFSVSQNGVLAYQTGKEQTQMQLAWFDRAGKRIGVVGEPEPYYPRHVEISPAGNRVAVGILDSTGTSDIWLIDLERNIRTKFTIGPEDDSDGIWSPDGTQLIYVTQKLGAKSVLAKKSTVIPDDAETLFHGAGKHMYASSWSPDGESVLCTAVADGKFSDLLLIPLGGDRTPRELTQTKHEEGNSRFSPDGRWIAYDSNESGQFEVYVAAFPGPGSKIQVSTTGGTEPRWRADGKELYYFARDNRLTAVEITTDGSAFDLGKSVPLFQAREVWLPGTSTRYDVSKDGQRFLVFAPVAETSPATISLIINWPEELKGK